MMGAMQKLRQWIQSYVGVSDLMLSEKVHHIEFLRALNAAETAEKVRHREVMAILEDQARLSHERYLALAEMVRQFEQRIIMKHIDQPREFTPPVLDWDTVQAIALHDLEKGQ